ncbi:putative RNA polymerase [Neospora caninum Liverpool]|uniref:DNA-directed RNA polymerase I subunit RPA12 n=1 Tax=Neospora caninum (strain Liverpool) TaxID=572307 RepID=F0VR41_NEOCL|nr:putative RNA polymerase [Neospora caninum Liverpool]CBZ56188.1 putative RNA polymerase [Neospora caninum Liverpool]CEL70949.1 TPA: RNA polymerase, putative [Neospora caninum Liverpool]|eukprot:XP_003886214.1 putative RNA polymerase [Neospora caninum Liverpool]
MPRSRSPLSSDALLLAQAASSLVVPLGSDVAFASPAAASGPPACQRLLHQSPQSLDDSVEYFALLHRLGDDAQTLPGPPKFVYQSAGFRPTCDASADKGATDRRLGGMGGVSCSSGISYDWLLALGCLNCGRTVTVADDLLPTLEDLDASASLTCRGCGHRIVPLHGANESDALVDCMHAGRHRRKAPTQTETQRDETKREETKEKSSGQEARDREEAPACTALGEDGIYLFGQRKQHRLGDFSKRWWKQRFLGERFGERLLEQQLRLVQAFSGAKKGVICKETCEACGHGEAFFSTFQARSADEGMTVMYECVKCGHRRVFNN